MCVWGVPAILSLIQCELSDSSFVKPNNKIPSSSRLRSISFCVLVLTEVPWMLTHPFSLPFCFLSKDCFLEGLIFTPVGILDFFQCGAILKFCLNCYERALQDCHLSLSLMTSTGRNFSFFLENNWPLCWLLSSLENNFLCFKRDFQMTCWVIIWLKSPFAEREKKKKIIWNHKVMPVRCSLSVKVPAQGCDFTPSLLWHLSCG